MKEKMMKFDLIEINLIKFSLIDTKILIDIELYYNCSIEREVL